jgi:hypothetical protein
MWVAQRKDENDVFSWGWIHTFILCLYMFQIMLLFPAFGVVRVPVRVAGFLLSIGSLLFLRSATLKHPSQVSALFGIGILIFSINHPTINNLVSGSAQVALLVATIAPLFWVTRLKISVQSLWLLIYIFWAFQTASAFTGLLQVYFPGQFQPFLSQSIQDSVFGGDNLKIVLSNGVETYRPLGLTDVPGGAALGGFYAFLIGIGIGVLKKNRLFIPLGIGSALIGLFVIYLSQVRSILVMCGVCTIFLAIVVFRQKKFRQFSAIAIILPTLFIGAFLWASVVGGESTVERFLTLFADDPGKVYQGNRGLFLEDTFTNLIWQYPLGAGLGRWGVMNGTFGTNSDPATAGLWAEIAWTGWLYDGGIPYLVSMVVAVGTTCFKTWSSAIFYQKTEIGIIAALIFAYDMAVVAGTFNAHTLFSNGGMEFWLLNTALFTATYSNYEPETTIPDRYR